MAFSAYPLTHRALVCTRMDMFRDMGDVNSLSTAGVVIPRLNIEQLEEASDSQAKRIVEFLFPVFLHNLIKVKDFPLRNRLEGALEQIEQSIQENAENPMIRELLTCGLKGEVCDPSGLPEDIDAKRAVALYLARAEWDTLYRTFSLKVVKTLVKHRADIAIWLREQSEKEGEPNRARA